MGGGHVVAQALESGLVDEFHLHLAPIVLGTGTPLYHGVGRIEMRQTDAQVSPNATHLTYVLA